MASDRSWPTDWVTCLLYCGKQASLPEIAKTLNVANLLEGSVRRSGNRLRVTTQLIRADTGEHLWSESYDRDLKDVFLVQDDIAAAVVNRQLSRTGPGYRRHGRIPKRCSYGLSRANCDCGSAANTSRAT